MEEKYEGKVIIEKVNQAKYLGFIISNQSNNQPNIREQKIKSIGTIRKILDRLQCLNLQQYYFECAIILKNVMLRTSILYASETYYNLTETELRQIERNEESFLRQIFATPRSCPIVQLYLETGQYPARFEIIRLKLLFLKYILSQNENTTIYKFLQLQLEKPTIKGEWASSCLADLHRLKIKLSLNEIKVMKIIKYKSLLKKKIREESLSYLLCIRKFKGHEIEYLSLQMSDYLLPNTFITKKEINN